MKYKIEIDLENAVFEDNPVFAVFTILYDAIPTSAEYLYEGVLQDENGNTVGFARIEP